MRRYLRRMETDSSPEVRRAALHQLAVSKATLPAIVRRTRDAKDVVRKHAFKMIGDKVRDNPSGPHDWVWAADILSVRWCPGCSIGIGECVEPSKSLCSANPYTTYGSVPTHNVLLLPQVDVSALSIDSRIRLLEGGLKDRTPGVRDACIDMLCNSW